MFKKKINSDMQKMIDDFQSDDSIRLICEELVINYQLPLNEIVHSARINNYQVRNIISKAERGDYLFGRAAFEEDMLIALFADVMKAMLTYADYPIEADSDYYIQLVKKTFKSSDDLQRLMERAGFIRGNYYKG